MNRTKIEYLTHTWNPLAMRCTPISEGCANCWHLAMVNRLAANPKIPEEQRHAYAGETGPVLVRSRLAAPFKVKKHAMVGVQFMGDLFHEDVPFAYLKDISRVMAACPQHTFLVLTKRPGRMAEFAAAIGISWPNVWLGTTVEHPDYLWRIGKLLEVPAAKHYVSLEPMLGAADLEWALQGWHTESAHHPNCGGERCDQLCPVPVQVQDPSLDWVQIGGESGPRARPMDLDGALSVVRQCKEVHVPVFVKQMGTAWAKSTLVQPGQTVYQAGDRKGAQMEYWPKELRVREYPGDISFSEKLNVR